MEKDGRSKGRMMDRRKMDGGKGEGLKSGRKQREKEETEKDRRSIRRRMEGKEKDEEGATWRSMY
jgi:hypothetical protein